MRSEPLLQSFIEYCKDHPEQRFWQALRNWCKWPFVCVADGTETLDTFYWEKNNKPGEPDQLA